MACPALNAHRAPVRRRHRSLSPSAPSRTPSEASGTPLAGREPRGPCPCPLRAASPPLLPPSRSAGASCAASSVGASPPRPGQHCSSSAGPIFSTRLLPPTSPPPSARPSTRALAEGGAGFRPPRRPPLAEDKEETRALKAELGSLSVPELNRMAARLVSPGLTRATSALLARARSGNEEAAALHPGLQDQAAGRIASNLRSVYRAGRLRAGGAGAALPRSAAPLLGGVRAARAGTGRGAGRPPRFSRLARVHLGGAGGGHARGLGGGRLRSSPTRGTCSPTWRAQCRTRGS